VAISSVSKGAARDVAALVRDQARSARGLAPVGPRRLPRQTIAHEAAGDEGVAGVVDVVHAVGEMPEIAAAGVRT
jgi:hypothetical protein